MRLARLVLADIATQWRQGVHAVGAIVLGIYLMVLVMAGAQVPDWAFALLAYSELAVLGPFLAGWVILLERGDGPVPVLPDPGVPIRLYLGAKLISLMLVILLSVTIIGAVRPQPTDWPLLMGATLLGAIAFLALGTALAVRLSSLGEYGLAATALMVPLGLPAGFAFIDPMPAWLSVLPPVSQLRPLLLASGHGEGGGGVVIGMAVVGALVAAFGWVVAERALAGERAAGAAG
ncbi:hypothetical protein [Pelagibacterium montanilacus]|uniref:hypothetical protein n=1 Tax=Pelagibacterium montanilacus TaxID=2185280 RepID=UPI000F8E21BB|nr:hypothetical protein [Pelagibacterium montanilacus]